MSDDTPDRPLFLCLDLTPDDAQMAASAASEPTVYDLLHRVAAAPWCFEREWRVFRDEDEARTHAANSPTVVVLPLVVEFNPLLGF